MGALCAAMSRKRWYSHGNVLGLLGVSIILTLISELRIYYVNNTLPESPTSMENGSRRFQRVLSIQGSGFKSGHCVCEGDDCVRPVCTPSLAIEAFVETVIKGERNMLLYQTIDGIKPRCHLTRSRDIINAKCYPCIHALGEVNILLVERRSHPRGLAIPGNNQLGEIS